MTKIGAVLEFDKLFRAKLKTSRPCENHLVCYIAAKMYNIEYKTL